MAKFHEFRTSISKCVHFRLGREDLSDRPSRRGARAVGAVARGLVLGVLHERFLGADWTSEDCADEGGQATGGGPQASAPCASPLVREVLGGRWMAFAGEHVLGDFVCEGR